MWKYYWKLFCWSITGAWSTLGKIELAFTIVGGAIVFLSPHWEEPMKNLFWIVPLTFFLALFVYRIIHAPYWFHQEQQKIIDSIFSDPGLDMKIGGIVISKALHMSKDTARLELNVTVVNRGYPKTAHGWELVLRTSTGDMVGRHTAGLPPSPGSFPNVPPLDNRLNYPLGTNEEFNGLINFIFLKIPKSELEKPILNDPGASLILSALDNMNQKWTEESNIQAMLLENFGSIPQA